MPKTQQEQNTPGSMRKKLIKRQRFAARITSEQKHLFEKAAALYDQPVSQFVISSAQRAAEQAIRDHEVIILSARYSQAVMESLLHPEPPGPWLRQAAEHYKAMMDEE